MPFNRLLDALQAPDAAVRIRAIDALARLGSAEARIRYQRPDVRTPERLPDGEWRTAERVGADEAAGALVLLLADPEPVVRQKAADALAAIGPPATAPVLRYLASWEGSVGTVIPDLLGRLRAAQGLDLLLGHLSEREPEIRAAIARALGRVGTDRAVSGLLDLLRDLNPDVKVAAARALGDLASPAGVDALLDELPDDNPAVRGAAAEALGRVGDRRAVDSLSRVAADDPAPEVRRAAEGALRRIARHSVSPLVRALAGDSLEERIRAMSSLIEQGRTAVMPLTGLLTHDEPAVRASAAEVLGAIGDPACLDALLPLTLDHEGPVRLAATRALGRIRHVRSAERLVQPLQDQDQKVAAAAADSLVALDELALEPVFRLLGSESRRAGLRAASTEARIRATDVLGRLRHKGACERLEQGLEDSVPWIRIVSCQALGEIGETRAVPALLHSLSDRDAVVRAMAAEALGKLRDYRATMPLLNLLRDESDLVRVNAVRAMGRIANPMAIPFVTQALDAPESKTAGSPAATELRVAAITALAHMSATAVLPRLRLLARVWPFSREPAEVKRAARWAVYVLRQARGSSAAPAAAETPDGTPPAADS
ncbi:hypothetical protein FJY71_04680 [candidate division WOR-3 bacterium]|nr:hypothetical protein [candidate division WOR-3 bacterium]